MYQTCVRYCQTLFSMSERMPTRMSEHMQNKLGVPKIISRYVPEDTVCQKMRKKHYIHKEKHIRL